MPCLLALIAIAFPRVVIVLIWLFGNHYFQRAYGSLLWPLLGFIFLPMTTLAFAFASNSLGLPGDVPPLGWLLVLIALAADLGLLRGGHSNARRWREARR